MAVKPIPDGYHTVTPYLYVRCSDEAIAFYTKAFGAVETMRLTLPGGGVCHAEVKIGDGHVMMADENPAWGNKGPLVLGGATAGFALYVPDVDAAFAKAVAAGAKVVRPVADQFYGDRSGTVADPFGHQWTLGTHVEDVPRDQLQSRMEAWMKANPM